MKRYFPSALFCTRATVTPCITNEDGMTAVIHTRAKPPRELNASTVGICNSHHVYESGWGRGVSHTLFGKYWEGCLIAFVSMPPIKNLSARLCKGGQFIWEYPSRLRLDFTEGGQSALGEEEPIPRSCILGEFTLFSSSLRTILISYNRRATGEAEQLV